MKMMRYVKAADVVSPRDFVRNVNVIFDGGLHSFSIAELEWEGEECFGMRWNVARNEWDRKDKQNGSSICLGMPTSHGIPVWFILPTVSVNYINQIIEDERKRLKEEGLLDE